MATRYNYDTVFEGQIVFLDVVVMTKTLHLLLALFHSMQKGITEKQGFL